MNNSNSCIETPAAPEWLQKLENRREKLSRGKLGHELGAGAPCDECRDKCPGLDLHFWRKVCRNCKCRKEIHRCPDDELSGWAQFEILGQIRSKPAFIKIKALASQPVQLEWVPPNVAPDIVSDYMEKLGTTQIPVAGSDAAQKRKQQLEFQVPPHDLDAALCDNLTEAEANQLLQYVQKIRDNCVGQGSVVRIGNVNHGTLNYLNNAKDADNHAEYAKVMNALNEVPVTDPVLAELLATEKLAKAIVHETPVGVPKMFMAFSQPFTESVPMELEQEALLSKSTKAKLCGLTKQSIASLVHNGPIYDKILAALEHKRLDISRDPKLGPIADFRKEYIKNPQFKQEIDSILRNDKPAQYTTPVKSKLNELAFNSPVPLKQPIQTRFGAQMLQETPIRKVKFDDRTSTILYDCGLPLNVAYEKDPIFAKIINSQPLTKAFEEARLNVQPAPVVVACSPLPPDFIDEPALSQPIKAKLQGMRVDMQTLQSALLNGPFHDRVFEKLKQKNINYGKCKLLAPLEQLRAELLSNRPLYEEIREYVTQRPDSLAIAYGSPQHAVKTALTASASNDSGFDSKPTTPGTLHADDLAAYAGKFATIPGIEDMNMYPTVEAMQKLNLNTPQGSLNIQSPLSASVPVPVLNCTDCLLPIHFGEVAVKAERAGRDIAWHPECFKCHACRELLADLVYFFHGGQVFCGRDLAIKLKIPRCKACDELIFTKEYTAAESATFHIKHFCCFHCDEPLAGKQYIPDDKSNMPLCLNCYEEYFAAACQRCHRPIGAAGQGISWKDIHWHADCFICAGRDCEKSLIGGRFCVKENMPFCSPACVRSILS